MHLADDVAAQTKADLVAAYDDAAGRTPVTTCYPFNYVGSAPDRYILTADLVTD